MKIKQLANLSSIKTLKIVAISSLAVGVATSISAAPAEAVSIGSGNLTFSDGATNSTPGTPITGLAGNFFTVDFDRGGNNTVTEATGTFGTLIPGVSLINSVPKAVNPSTGNFLYVAGAPAGSFDYRLTNLTGLDFDFGPSIGNLNIAANSIFRGSFAGGSNVNFSLNPLNLATFRNGSDSSPVNVQNFDFSISSNTDRTGSYGLSVTAVPEPFTIIGTIIGGTAAFRMRKKLSSSAKNAKN
jgi:hypothetical protein